MATQVHPTQRPSLAGDIGQVIKDSGIVEQLVTGLVTALLGALTGLLSRKKPTPPSKPVTEPTPAPGSPDEFPDDHIPRPPAGRVVTKVTLHLVRSQYSKERFPAEYTPDNPFGLVPDGELRSVEAGNGALNWGNKFWLDLTAYDQDGHEFLRPDVLALGLAFKTEIRCGDACIIGHGAGPDGEPVAGYETKDTDAIGNGISAWLSSKGFLHQMQAFAAADGQVFHCSGSVAGVKSNEFDLKIN